MGEEATVFGGTRPDVVLCLSRIGRRAGYRRRRAITEIVDSRVHCRRTFEGEFTLRRRLHVAIASMRGCNRFTACL